MRRLLRDNALDRQLYEGAAALVRRRIATAADELLAATATTATATSSSLSALVLPPLPPLPQWPQGS